MLTTARPPWPPKMGPWPSSETMGPLIMPLRNGTEESPLTLLILNTPQRIGIMPTQIVLVTLILLKI